MALRIQIAKLNIHQYLLRANSPNLMLAKFSRYTVAFPYNHNYYGISWLTGQSIQSEDEPMVVDMEICNFIYAHDKSM